LTGAPFTNGSRRFDAGGLDALEDAPRSGRPATHSPQERAEVVAAALHRPQELKLPFGGWSLDRLTAYLNEHKHIALQRRRVGEILLEEGLRWRKQAPWFGAEQVDGSGANFKKGRCTDPVFLGERASRAGQFGPKMEICTRTAMATFAYQVPPGGGVIHVMLSA
jgi:transposase